MQGDTGGGERLSPARLRLFALLTVALTVIIGIAAIEWGLKRVSGGPDLGDRLDEGMFVHHPRLGWALVPGWTGRHQNIDFDVTYTVNRRGHRGTTVEGAKPPGQRRIAYLGDSFTFAMGVNDGDTFTEVLNRAESPAVLHLNFGHPGYSTDQEMLFAEDRMFFFDPDVVVLVVYLGNDLIDNLAAYPLQVEFAKPYFALAGGALTLHRVPVPRPPKPAALQRRTYADAIAAEAPPFARVVAHSEILSRLASLLPAADQSASLAARHGASIDLFEALALRLNALTREEGAELVVGLLPGKSFVDEPGGVSAQYQEVIRKAVMARLGAKGIPVIDVATPLQGAYAAGRKDLYHPREGHLSPAGNRFVAEVIGANLPPAVPAEAVK